MGLRWLPSQLSATRRCSVACGACLTRRRYEQRLPFQPQWRHRHPELWHRGHRGVLESWVTYLVVGYQHPSPALLLLAMIMASTRSRRPSSVRCGLRSFLFSSVCVCMCVVHSTYPCALGGSLRGARPSINHATHHPHVNRLHEDVIRSSIHESGMTARERRGEERRGGACVTAVAIMNAGNVSRRPNSLF